MNGETRVAVIGGGIAGLAAARVLVRARGPQVTLFEAGPRLGGKIRTETIAGHTVDLGPEGLLARVPAAIELCRELGIEDELVAAAELTTSVWTRGRLRELPPGVLSGMPAGIGPVLRSGILSPAGIARASLDLVLPASRARTVGDLSVGELVTRRLGRQALERLVDPLLGTIYGADCDQLSVRATAPQLDALAREHRSLIRGLRAAAPAPQSGPMFVTLRGGLERMVTRLGEELRDADVRCGAPVRQLHRTTGDRYRIEMPGGESLPVDGVVIAAPADQAGHILRAVSPAAARELESVRYSSAVVITLRYSADAGLQSPHGTGFLVPKSERRLLGACTRLSAKWPHFAATGEIWLRCSVARAAVTDALGVDDATLVARAEGELQAAIGLRGMPLDARVTRWEHALPHYEPGHLDRVERIEQELAGLPAVALAGAAYRGMGVPQCIAQGRAAAEQVLDALALQVQQRAAQVGVDVRAARR